MYAAVACSGKDDTFVVTGRWVPFVVEATTGRSRATITHRTCIMVDPLGPNSVDGRAGLVEYDLGVGARSAPGGQDRHSQAGQGQPERG